MNIPNGSYLWQMPPTKCPKIMDFMENEYSKWELFVAITAYQTSKHGGFHGK